MIYHYLQDKFQLLRLVFRALCDLVFPCLSPTASSTPTTLKYLHFPNGTFSSTLAPLHRLFLRLGLSFPCSLHSRFLGSSDQALILFWDIPPLPTIPPPPRQPLSPGWLDNLFCLHCAYLYFIVY